MMKADKNWTDALRDALRDAETPPPVGGWERLSRALAEQSAAPAAGRMVLWRRLTVAAAAVLVGVGVGEYLWRQDAVPVQDTLPVPTPELAAGIPLAAQPETESLIAESTGLTAQATAATPIRVRCLTTVAVQPDALAAEDAAAISATENQPATADIPQDEDDAPATRSKAGAVAAKTAHSAAGRSRMAEESDWQAVAQPHKKASFGVFGGGALNGASAGGGSVGQFAYDVSQPSDRPQLNTDGTVTFQRNNYTDGSFRHHQPLSFGLSVRKEFAHGLSLESGVNYTLLRSDVTMKYTAEELSQQLHFIGVPLRVNWQFMECGRFSLYIGAGGMAEKCVYAKLGGSGVTEKEIQWSAAAALGGEYRLGGVVGLYFEPVGSYYFTQTQLRTSRTDSPLTFTLRLGVRLSF